MTFCPDCAQEIPDSEFVTHREDEHPPSRIVVTITEPITSSEGFGWESQPPR